MFFSKKKLIGLDIGTHSIKAIEISKGRNQFVIENLQIIETPVGAFSSGEIVDVQALSVTLSDFFSMHKLSKKNISLPLSGAQVMVKKIPIPNIDQSLIGDHLKWEAEQYIPYDINEVNLDYVLLNNMDDEGNRLVLLVAAVQESVSAYLQLSSQAGLNVDVLDVSGFALFNTFNQNYEYLAEDRIVLMNIGSHLTNFVVVENKEVIFCRDIPAGGSSYTQELEKVLGIDFHEAETLKISASKGEEVPDEVINSINSFHDYFCDELNSTIEYFLNSNSGDSFSASYVSGGGLNVYGLYERLARNYKVKRLNPFKKVEVNEKSVSKDSLHNFSDYFAVAMGLALGKVT